jgi:hypothetical protein
MRAAMAACFSRIAGGMGGGGGGSVMRFRSED